MTFSPSKINTFYDCNRKYRLQYVDKIKVWEEQMPFFEKGTFYHHALEHYPNPPKKKFAFRLATALKQSEYKKQITDFIFTDEAQKLLSTEHYTEQRIYIDENWQPCKGRKNSMINGIVDYYTIEDDKVLIIDWKSGKVYKNKTEVQLMMYALWIFAKYPEINTVKAMYFYIEHEDRPSKTYHRKGLDELKSEFLDIINNINKEKDFKKNPSYNCKFCKFRDLHCNPYTELNNRRNDNE